MSEDHDNMLSDVVAFFAPLSGVNQPLRFFRNGTIAARQFHYRLAWCEVHKAVILFAARHPLDLAGFHTEDPTASDILYPDRLILARAFIVHQSLEARKNNAPITLDVQRVLSFIAETEANVPRANLRENTLHHVGGRFNSEFISYRIMEEEDLSPEGARRASIHFASKTIKDYQPPEVNGKDQGALGGATEVLTSSAITHVLHHEENDPVTGAVVHTTHVLAEHALAIMMADFAARTSACWHGKDPLCMTEDRLVALKRRTIDVSVAIRSAADSVTEKGLRHAGKKAVEAITDFHGAIVSLAIDMVSKIGERPEVELVPEELLPLVIPHFPRFSAADTDLRQAVVRPDPDVIKEMGIRWLDWEKMRPSFAVLDPPSFCEEDVRREFSAWLISHSCNPRMAVISYHHEGDIPAHEILRQREGTAWIRTSSGLQIFWRHGSREAYFYYAPPLEASHERQLAPGAEVFFEAGKVLKVSLTSGAFISADMANLKKELPDLRQADLPASEKPAAQAVQQVPFLHGSMADYRAPPFPAAQP